MPTLGFGRNAQYSVSILFCKSKVRMILAVGAELPRSYMYNVIVMTKKVYALTK